YPSQFLKPLLQRFDPNLSLCVISDTHKDADAPHTLRLLRTCRERKRRSRAAHKRDELAPPHSITSSARASSVGGTSSPSPLAGSTLLTSSYSVAYCPGRSPPLVPRRMRSTYVAAPRH